MYLEKFKFSLEPELIETKKCLHNKWAKYTNMVLRCLLKLEKVHKIYL